MDLTETLKAFADSKGWKFIHARRDYQNLQSTTDFISSETETYGTGETFLFLDPVVRKPEGDGITYSGNFLILTNSDLDKDYDDKFEDYIKPLISIVAEELKSFLRCDYDINDLTILEVINVFDFNSDGVSVRFNLKGY